MTKSVTSTYQRGRSAAQRPEVFCPAVMRLTPSTTQSLLLIG